MHAVGQGASRAQAAPPPANDRAAREAALEDISLVAEPDQIIVSGNASLGGYGGHMMIWKAGLDGLPQLVTCIDFNTAAGSLASRLSAMMCWISTSLLVRTKARFWPAC